MKHFLNDFMELRRECTDEELEPLGKIFSSTMEFIFRSLGDRAFRPERALNIAVFDSVATSIAHMLQGENPLGPMETKKAYMNLLTNRGFNDGYLRSTSDKENVMRRFREAKSAFGIK